MTTEIDVQRWMAEGRRFCYFVPADGLVPGRGFRASLVFEGVAGHLPTGNWPYTGAPDQMVPYFWGKDFAMAETCAAHENARLGLTKDDVWEILSSSMRAGSLGVSEFPPETPAVREARRARLNAKADAVFHAGRKGSR